MREESRIRGWDKLELGGRKRVECVGWKSGVGLFEGWDFDLVNEELRAKSFEEVYYCHDMYFTQNVALSQGVLFSRRDAFGKNGVVCGFSPKSRLGSS